MRRLLMLLGVAVVCFAFYGQAMAADGANIYATKCSPCHGKDAKGSAMAPQLAGGEFVKKSDDATIKQTVSEGRSGAAKKYPNFPLAMPAWKASISAADIDAVVAYLKGLK